MCYKDKKENKKKTNCLQGFSSEGVLIEHKKTCLEINGEQNVKLRRGSITFKKYFKQLAVPFRIYTDFGTL